MPSIQDIAQAISRFENVDPKYNNPGALMDVDYYKQTGQFRLMTYPSYADGMRALEAQISRDANRGFNFYEWIARYAPAGHGGNDPQHYAKTIAGWLGVDPNVRVIDAIKGTVSNGSGGGFSLPTFSTTAFGFGFDDTALRNAGDTFMTMVQNVGSDSDGLGLDTGKTVGVLAIAVIAGIMLSR